MCIKIHIYIYIYIYICYNVITITTISITQATIVLSSAWRNWEFTKGGFRKGGLVIIVLLF